MYDEDYNEGYNDGLKDGSENAYKLNPVTVEIDNKKVFTIDLTTLQSNVYTVIVSEIINTLKESTEILINKAIRDLITEEYKKKYKRLNI